MNKRLQLVFEKIIPTLGMGVDYWVYGGVAIAGVNGSFFRENKDVDVFVYDEDYPKTIDLISKLDLGLKYKEASLLRDIRPKIDFYVEELAGEILSIIPVYKLADGEIKFIYHSDFIPQNELTKVVRTIGEYSFITPSNDFIKEQFLRKIGGNLSKKEELDDKRKKDAEVLFGEDYGNIISKLYFEEGVGRK